MNKNIFLILIIALFYGCAEEIEFSNPAVQGNFEGQAWRATVHTASTKDGGLIVRAQRGSEILLLFTTRTDVGQYPLGNNNQSEARFRGADLITYSTLNAPDSSVQVFPSDGLIEITELNSVTNTVTGEFRFNAFTVDGLNSVNFIDGVFFQVPIRENILETTGGSTCDLASAAINDLQTEIMAFEPAPDVDLCLQYQQALEVQVSSCVDVDGSLQMMLDNIDCEDSDGDGRPNSFEDINMDGNLDNDDTDMDGIPNYLDDDDDGDFVPTAIERGDLDGDGIPNYLDVDDDGDGIFTIFEAPTASQNTDGDSLFDYLDTDDDGDGILTIDENPDPNGDGNPDDAVDTDMDGTPDYLQN
ncbi:DUF6252 family protein [Winogradskyella jejuensis]|uniref:Thrombospondin type 3 repeat-containing protein n=1 Tax=Winogradskyella jejuensis TaxID=1089305 RepID=A0A1M5P5Y7_9FLAO|nr:DUF6252 family protein [Winogradskyella jejuensis]SHG97135.1 hypothetical protein SAMN05444148_1387 [Winogradskyella jejuensis]